MLRITHLKTERSSKKLNVRLLKSFKINKTVKLQAYRLKLSVSYKMHSIFHVSLLKSYHVNIISNKISFSPLSVNRIIEEENEK